MKSRLLVRYSLTAMTLLAVTQLSQCFTDDNDPIVSYPDTTRRDGELTAGACIRLATLGNDPTSVDITSIDMDPDGYLVAGRTTGYEGVYTWTCSTTFDSVTHSLEAQLLTYEFTAR